MFLTVMILVFLGTIWMDTTYLLSLKGWMTHAFNSFKISTFTTFIIGRFNLLYIYLVTFTLSSNNIRCIIIEGSIPLIWTKVQLIVVLWSQYFHKLFLMCTCQTFGYKNKDCICFSNEYMLQIVEHIFQF